ncbi:MAG: sugar ABC transporter permease [Vallitalea sp.]|nr:sugar ABC transporter permease [Vallitalea sp.]
MKKNSNIAYALIAPTYILFGIFFLFPLLFSVYLTFFKWNGFAPNMDFVGMKNYVRIFSDPNFLNALKNTCIYTVITVPLSICISLVLSYILDNKIFGYEVLKGIYFLPHIVSLVAVGVVWLWIFLPGKYGLVNSMLSVFSIKPQNWMADPKLAMGTLVVIGVWKSVGYNMVIFIAGLLSIPKSLYEAADIDGANSIQKFLRITLPQLKGTIFFVTVSSTIYALFQVFDIVKVTTNGGPIGKTEMIVTYLYKVGIKQFELGYASVIAFVLFLMTALITVIQRKFLEER